MPGESAMTDDRYRSRKFRLAVGAFVTFTGLLVAGLIDQGVYATLSLSVLGGYGLVNYAQKRMVP